jgi:hypothetical protein
MVVIGLRREQSANRTPPLVISRVALDPAKLPALAEPRRPSRSKKGALRREGMEERRRMGKLYDEVMRLSRIRVTLPLTGNATHCDGSRSAQEVNASSPPSSCRSPVIVPGSWRLPSARIAGSRMPRGNAVIPYTRYGLKSHPPDEHTVRGTSIPPSNNDNTGDQESLSPLSPSSPVSNDSWRPYTRNRSPYPLYASNGEADRSDYTTTTKATRRSIRVCDSDDENASSSREEERPPSPVDSDDIPLVTSDLLPEATDNADLHGEHGKETRLQPQVPAQQSQQQRRR